MRAFYVRRRVNTFPLPFTNIYFIIVSILYTLMGRRDNSAYILTGMALSPFIQLFQKLSFIFKSNSLILDRLHPFHRQALWQISTGNRLHPNIDT